ncbi:unnamed protein product [Lampetra fluviatilis]
MSPPPDVPTLLPPRNQTTDANRSVTTTIAAAASMLPSERLVALSVMTTLIACTIAGNLLVVAFIAYFRHLQTRTNAFALSLALADFLVGLLIMPYSTMRSVDSCWPYGGVFCRVHTWLDFSLTTSSVVHLCCISYDRYVAVADPLHYPQRVTRRVVALLLLCCWLSVPVYSWPIMSGWYSVGVPDGPGAFAGCREVCPVSVSATFGLANMLCAYAAPMLLMSLTYAKIYRLARAQARKIDTATAGLRRRGPADRADGADGDGRRWKAAMRHEHNATKTLGVIAGVFVLCWVPYFVLSATDSLLDDATRRAAADISNWLTYVNSTLNPVLIVALNRSFRNAFRATVACRVFAPGFRATDLFNYDDSER